MIKFLLLLLISFSAFATEPGLDTVKMGVKGGLGIVSPELFDGNSILVHLGAFYINKEKIISARFTYTEEFIILGPKPVQYLYEFGLLYGRQYSTRFFRFAGSIGLAAITGNIRGATPLYTGPGWLGSTTYNEITYFTQGLPLELSASFIHFKWIELSANVLANLNSRNSYLAGSLCLGLGHLK